MSQDYLLTLCREYLNLIAQAQDPLLDADERHHLSAQRTVTHDTLIAMLGPAYARPFDMAEFSRAVVRDAQARDKSATLHEAIIERAIRHDGWQRGDWRAAFIKRCQEQKHWQADLYDNDQGREIWGGFRRNPDAWRIVAEDEATPGREWLKPILVMEFLEVEIEHAMPLEKRRAYTGLWWRFDGTGAFHCRVYTAGRYGRITCWLDEDTIHHEEL